MKQIRLYYESLEQGFDYIRPAIRRSLGNNTDIVFVRRAKKASDLNEGALSAMLSMQTPDALITGISDGIEYPLVLIEFTEAVTTEDHELQRTYGALAACLSNCYYLKIAGEKQSEKEFGGADYNPYSSPKIFKEKVNYEGYIIANWDTETGNDYTLRRNDSFPSCPPVIPICEDTISAAVKAFEENPKGWYNRSLDILKTKDSYQSFIKKVNQATGTKELVQSWSTRRDSNLNKLRYFVKDDYVAAKINRFGHAMDPDRGILTFMSLLFSEEKKVYGIYALVRPRGGTLLSCDMTSLDLMRKKFVAALEKDSGGLPAWLQKELIKKANSATSMTDVINIQDVWEKNKSKINESKVVMTVAYFLDGLKLNHNGITFVWDKRKLIGTTERNFIPAYSKKFHFGVPVAPTKIARVRNEVDEDEVTYALVHKVLIPNGFSIVSVSYPGAQGGNAVLPNPENGKAQERIYVDTIAVPPANSDIDVVLNESKGMFNQREVESDVDKILQFKRNPKYKKALNETLLVAKVIDRNKRVQNIVVGVSFGVQSTTQTSWQPGTVDFIFRIVNRERWAIGIFNQSLLSLIPTIEGDTDFPAINVLSKSTNTLFP